MVFHRLSVWFFAAGSGLVALSLLVSAATVGAGPAPEPTPTTTTTTDPLAVVAYAPEATAEPLPDQACRDCHTDREQLELLAKPPEVVESLSEGPG